ncbi:hypothetical protein [Winogradskyella sp. PG-2]|uniref:hypothetical protein n=1 Tax=Winogradskyella sp. PG-2 TaxID=754409 RepID=UPI0004585D83|nr:hypothetical protein [Winogradskyella sp. PG-2]BAO77036.1 hypothetical protein WPG_2806 [Winogradskyella sp. PG-2]
MDKTLFLLCPTDCLEPIINNRFRQENFFYTSLGNSFSLDFTTLEGIKELITKHDIKDISFVTSNDNKIVLDALGKQSFSKIRGLKKFYGELVRQKEHSEALWEKENLQFAIISYYLNYKIKELGLELNRFTDYPIKIDGKIYDGQKNTFNAIHSNLICLEMHCLN